MIHRFLKWITIYNISAWRRRLLMFNEFECMKNELIKHFFKLHFLFDRALIEDVEQLQQIPFQTLHFAFNLTKHFLFSANNCQNLFALFFVEILKTDCKANQFLIFFLFLLQTVTFRIKNDEYSWITIQ